MDRIYNNGNLNTVVAMVIQKYPPSSGVYKSDVIAMINDIMLKEYQEVVPEEIIDEFIEIEIYTQIGDE